MVEEVLRLDGESDGLNKATQSAAEGMNELAVAFNGLVTASAQVSKNAKGLKILTGRIITATKEGEKLATGFKVTHAQQQKIIRGELTWADALKKTSIQIKAQSQTTVGATAALKELIAANTESLRVQEIRGALSRGNVQRAAVRAPLQRPATQAETLNVAKASDALKKLAKDVKVTGAQIDRIFKDLSRGSVRDYGAELNKIRDKAAQLLKAEGKLGAEAEAAHLKAAKAAGKQARETAKADTATQKLVKTIASLARVGAISLFIGALFRLQQAFEDGLVGAAQLSIKVAEIETIAGKATLTTEMWTSELRKLSDSFGLDILDQAEGAYQTLSTQIAKGADALQFLTIANKLALAGVTDVASAVKLTATLINAFNKDISEAGDISGKLFKTVELGVVRIEELAQGLGRISVPAAKLGIRMEELLAAIAQTTRQGVKFSEAATLIRGIIQKTIKPTGELQKILNELGFSSGEAAIQALGLGGFLGELDKRTQGSSTELGKLFNRVRAVTGAMIFAGEGVAEFNRTVAQIDASGIVTLNKAADRIQATIGKRFDRVKNRIVNFFLVDIGPPVLKVLLNITEGLISMGKSLKDFTKAISQAIPVTKILTGTLTFLAVISLPTLIRQLAISGLTLVIWAGQTLIAAAAALKTAIAFAAMNAPLVILAVGLAAAVIAYQLTIDHLAQAQIEADEFTNSIANQTEELIKNREALAELTNVEILKGIKERNREVRKGLSEENAAIEEAQRARLAALGDIRDATQAVNKVLTADVKKRATDAQAAFKKFGSGVAKTASDITKSFQAASKELFSFDISIAADKTQLKLVENQLINLQAEQQAAAIAGDKARFERVSSQIKAVSKQRFAVVTRIKKAQGKADQDIFKARADLLRAQSKGDRAGIQAAKDKLKDAKELRFVVGSAGQDELDVQQQVREIRRKLSRLSFGSSEAKALKVELDGLRRLQQSIGQQNIEEEKQRQRIVGVFSKERKLRLQLADELATKAKAAFKEQVRQQIILAELVDLEKKRRDFNLATLLKTGDEEKITTESLKQLKNLQQLANLQKQLGIETSDRLSLENEIFLIRKAALDASRKAGNKQQIIRINQVEETASVQLKSARKLANEENKADIARIARLQAGLQEFAKGVTALGAEEFGIVTAGQPTEAGARSQQNILAKEIRSLVAQLGRAAEDPTVAVGLSSAVERLVDRIAAQQVRGELAGPERFEGEELLSAFSAEFGRAGVALAGRLGLLQAEFEAATLLAANGNKAAGKFAEELQRRINIQSQAEKAGARAQSINIQQTILEIEAREAGVKSLNASVANEIATFKARAAAVVKSLKERQNFTDVARKITAGLRQLESEISDLEFNKALLLAGEKAFGDKRFTDPVEQEKIRDKIGEQLQLTGNQPELDKVQKNAVKAAKPEEIDNQKAGALAKRPIEIETAKMAGRIGAQARATEEDKIATAKKKAEDVALKKKESLEKQAAKQKRLAEIGTLTGIAKLIAQADEREQRRVEGRERGGATPVADQNRRNAEFLRRRRERKILETNAAREREKKEAGGLAPVAALVIKAEERKKEAERQIKATPESKAAQVNLERAIKQLEIAKELQKREVTTTPKKQEETLKDVAKAEAQKTQLVLLDDDEPLRLLIGSLDRNSEALKSFQVVPGGLPKTPAQFGNLPIPQRQTQQNFIPQVFPRAPSFSDLGGVVEPPVFKFEVKSGDVNLDGKKVGAIIAPIIRKSTARANRANTNPANK